MSISPVEPSASRSAVQPDPSPVVGKASPVSDPIVSSGSPKSGAAPAASAASESEVTQAVSVLQNAFGSSGLSFSTDKESGLTVIKVTDSKTDQLIRQIPTQEALDITHSIDKLRGNLINAKA
jgi:flagellar protein FlaG